MWILVKITIFVKFGDFHEMYEFLRFWGAQKCMNSEPPPPRNPYVHVFPRVDSLCARVPYVDSPFPIFREFPMCV